MKSALYLLLAFALTDVSMADCVSPETSPGKSTAPFVPFDDHSSSWARLEIASIAMASMPYHDEYRINIYKHSRNNVSGSNEKKRFFYAPIVLLDHQSAYSSFNNVTNEPELRFRVEMWNKEVEEQIAKYIKVLTDETVLHSQVEIIPFDKVILSSNSETKIAYTLIKEWTPYQFHKWIWFRIICFSLKECDHLAENMKTSPQQFSNLKLLFSQSAQKTQRRETVIRVDNIMAGEMAAKLDQRFSSKPDALLTAQDEKRLLTESSTNVLIDSFDDSDVVSPTTEAQIYNMLQDMLVSSRSIIKDQSDVMWESVFWDDDNYRPDKTTKTWSELHQTQSKEVQKKMEETFSESHKKDKTKEHHLRQVGFSKHTGFETSKSGSKSKEEIDKLYIESKDSVEWEGTKFTPKSMSLSRINMNNLRNTQTLQDRSVRVSYSTAVLSVALNFRTHSDQPSKGQTLHLESRLTKMEMELNQTKSDVQVLKADLHKTEVALAHTKSDVKAITPPKPVAGPMPTSCINYKTMGHTQSGFYLITGNSNQVKTIYCDFSKPDASGYEKMIGKVDVKTTDVHFYVQRTHSFSLENHIISFDVATTNVGGAMHTSSGVFTAPVSGTYHFEYTGVKESSSPSLAISLQKNGGNIGHAWTDHGNSASLSAHLHLVRGDKISLYKMGRGTLHDTPAHNTHFTGWLVQEDSVVAHHLTK